MKEPLESDWKKFRAMTATWRERYLAAKNRQITAVLTDANKTETERFWDAEELIEKEARNVQLCLDDLRRSRMWERLIAMRTVGMIRREDLADFSQELQDQVFYDLPRENG